MDPDLQDLMQRCSAAQERGRLLLDRQVQLIAARSRLRHHGLTVLEEFTSLARSFYDSVAARHDRDG
ncbi:MAG TPA: hypothetical protein VN605_02625 [Thermoanaerobaculia bacterium]|nr:hypothetical protein [Thermoanaerobaculia bacterium]